MPELGHGSLVKPDLLVVQSGCTEVAPRCVAGRIASIAPLPNN